MTPKSIFTIILKFFALSMLYNLTDTLPAWVRRIPFQANDSSLLYYLAIMVVVLFLYFFIVWALLFRSIWIIDKLKLDKNFEKDEINIQIKGISVLQIAIIVLSGLILTNAIPNLFSDFIYYYQIGQTSDASYSKELNAMMINMWNSLKISMTIFNSCKIVLGILLLTYNKQLTNWIERKNTNPNQQEEITM